MWRIDSSELPQKGTLTPDRLYLDVTAGKNVRSPLQLQHIFQTVNVT